MARRSGAKLATGTSVVDYRSPASIVSTFAKQLIPGVDSQTILQHLRQNPADQKRVDTAIRAEYSRQRSILRKRVERMEAAGETANQFFSRFGDIKKSMPTAKGLSTQEMMQRMAAMSRAIGGGYQATLTEVKASRKSAMERVRQEAEDAGDDVTADFLSKELTPKQAEKVNRVWAIVRAVMGKSLGKAIGSGGLDVKIHETVIEGGQSVLAMGAQVLSDYDADIADLETIKERFTQTGKTRVAWAKAHRKRR